jgi:hypothetical protein
MRGLPFQHPHRVTSTDKPAHLDIARSPAKCGQRGIEIQFWLAPFLAEIEQQDILDVVRSANGDFAFARSDRQAPKAHGGIGEKGHSHVGQAANNGIDDIDMHILRSEGMGNGVFADFAHGHSGGCHNFTNAIERNAGTNAENFERIFLDWGRNDLFLDGLMFRLRLLGHHERGRSKKQDAEYESSHFLFESKRKKDRAKNKRKAYNVIPFQRIAKVKSGEDDEYRDRNGFC